MATVSNVFDGLPNLRNGNANQYTVLHIAAGIPAAYNYLPITDGNAPTDFLRFLAVEAAIYAHRLVDAGDAVDEARKKAVVLAAVRLGIRKSWNLTQGDLIAAQAEEEAYYVARHIVAGALDPANIDTTLPEAPVRAHYQVISQDQELMEPSVLAKLLKFGMAAPVVMGVILVKTDGMHHFVDPHKNVFRAVMRQVLGSTDDIPYGLTQEVFEDIVAHKAAHPIATQHLVQFARDPQTRVRLMAAGIASAGVRVPAMYAAESAMSAVKSLVTKVQAIGRSANIDIDMDAFEAKRNGVFANLDLNNAAGRSAASTNATNFTAEHGTDLARCMGILQATCDNAQIARPDLMRSYALRRVVADNPAAVAEGTTQMTTFYRVVRERARRGILTGMGLFGAEVPAQTKALPVDETLNQILTALVGSNAKAAAPAAQVQGN